jgi:hypothetical protein
VSDLARQQERLLRALWQARPDDAARLLEDWSCGDEATGSERMVRGLRAYRSNGRALAVRALEGAYPVVAQLLGEENFASLAHRLWMQHPPACGDVAQWGAELAACIEALPELAAEEPYLADVARLEWTIHCSATAADGAADTASFALLMEQDPAQLTLRLCPGTQLLASAWPAASIVLAHLEGEPSLERAGQRLRDGVAETALVWREGLRPRVRVVDAAERPFIVALQERRSLADALQAASQLDVQQWLAPAVQSGLVLGVQPL